MAADSVKIAIRQYAPAGGLGPRLGISPISIKKQRPSRPACSKAPPAAASGSAGKGAFLVTE